MAKVQKYRKVKINVSQIDGFEIGTENVWDVELIFLKSMKLPHMNITVNGGLESEAMGVGHQWVDEILKDK